MAGDRTPEEYIEVALLIPAEALEAVTHLLHEHGTGGVVIDDEAAARVRAYLPRDERLDARLAALRATLSDLVAFFPGMAEWHEEQRLVRTEDWANAWRVHYHPVHIGDRLVIAPTWSGYVPSAGEVVVWLDPGMAFGTGTHPSTTLCLRALDDLVSARDSVLDVGTGSGILAVAAALLGARRVRALDVDPLAVRIARENVEQNGLRERVGVQHGELQDLLAGGLSPATIVVANLTADVLCGLAQVLAAAVAHGGALVASGIVAASQSRVEAAFSSVGLRPWRATQEEDWVAVWARRG